MTDRFKPSNSGFTVCGVSWCDEDVVAHDIPLCAAHWHATPRDRRQTYCGPPADDAAVLVEWVEANLPHEEGR